jgi:hypothetical protein
MRYLTTCALVLLSLFVPIIAQSAAIDSMQTVKPHYALHISSPIGLISKIGFKFESRSANVGNLVCINRYFKGGFPDYPGTQLAFERRYYKAVEFSKRSENFFYTKLLAGYQEERAAYGESFLRRAAVPSGNYAGLGVGIGRRVNFRHFFLELNGGMKAVVSSAKQDKSFYITGPASVLELHLNWGFRF